MFVVEDKYMYIHIPKTGGTYVTNVFENVVSTLCSAERRHLLPKTKSTLEQEEVGSHQ